MPELRTVVLRHELPDGSAHIDWMLARDTRELEPLITLRLDEPPEHAAASGVVAERLVDHRPAYLDYEGPISGERGVVHRVDRGVIRLWEGRETDRWWLIIAWEGSGAVQGFACQRLDGASWRLVRHSPAPRDPPPRPE